MIEEEMFELKALHRDYAKLLDFGVNEDFVRRLNPVDARDLLKGILYLRYRDYSPEGE